MPTEMFSLHVPLRRNRRRSTLYLLLALVVLELCRKKSATNDWPDRTTEVVVGQALYIPITVRDPDGDGLQVSVSPLPLTARVETIEGVVHLVWAPLVVIRGLRDAHMNSR